MMVTTMTTILTTSAYYGVNRISKSAFTKVMAKFAAPSVLKERQPGSYYDALTTNPATKFVDPLFVLAIFQHESNMGKAGTSTQTYSWGNTRTPLFGPRPKMNPNGTIVLIAGRSGSFPAYKNWLDGMLSTAARLAADNFYYRFERRTIGGVFNDPVAANPGYRPAMNPIPRQRDAMGKVVPIEWAPAGDLNDPAGYLRGVLDFMNQYADQEINTLNPLPLPTPSAPPATLFLSERQNQALLYRAVDSIPYPLRGDKVLEGMVNLTAFGGSDHERFILFDKLGLHTLAGKWQTLAVYGSLADTVGYDALKAAGLVTEYR
jgi:hypothetical protein